MTLLYPLPSLEPPMATPVDPYDRAAIEALASFGLWKQAGLVEALRFLEMLKRQQSPHTATELSHPTRQTTHPQVFPLMPWN